MSYAKRIYQIVLRSNKVAITTTRRGLRTTRLYKSRLYRVQAMHQTKALQCELGSTTNQGSATIRALHSKLGSTIIIRALKSQSSTKTKALHSELGSLHQTKALQYKKRALTAVCIEQARLYNV